MIEWALFFSIGLSGDSEMRDSEIRFSSYEECLYAKYSIQRNIINTEKIITKTSIFQGNVKDGLAKDSRILGEAFINSSLTEEGIKESINIERKRLRNADIDEEYKAYEKLIEDSLRSDREEDIKTAAQVDKSRIMFAQCTPTKKPWYRFFVPTATHKGFKYFKELYKLGSS